MTVSIRSHSNSPAIPPSATIGVQRFTLKYAIYRGGWDIQTVSDEGRSSSLAFDGSGRPCISYYDSAKHALNYATAAAGGGSWIIQPVDEDVGATVSSSCLVFNPAGQPAIAYAATTRDPHDGRDYQEIRYAVLKGRTWVRETAVPYSSTKFSYPSGWRFTGVSLAFSPYRYNEEDPYAIVAFSVSDPSLSPWSMRVWWRDRAPIWEEFHDLNIFHPSDGGCLGRNLNAGETVLAYHDHYAEAIKYAVDGPSGPEPFSIVEKSEKDRVTQYISGPFGMPSLAFKFGDQPGISYYDAANADYFEGGFIKFAIGTRSVSLLDILSESIHVHIPRR